MDICYKDSLEAWDNYHQFLHDLILRHKPEKICEIGAGANPAIHLDFIHTQGIEYTIIDISQDELDKAPQGYIKVCADITSDEIKLENSYDFVFSKMLAEHVPDGKQFHMNVRKLLKSGGMAFHFFPTLFSLPFSANKIMPEYISYKLLTLFAKERDNEGKFGKFPAYYNMCYGPTAKQIKTFISMGYNIDSYIGFFGHTYYKKIPPLNFLSRLATKLLIKFPLNFLTSYSYLLLVKK